MSGITPAGYALFTGGRNAKTMPWVYDSKAKCDICEKASVTYRASMPYHDELLVFPPDQNVKDLLWQVCTPCLHTMAKNVYPVKIACSPYEKD